MRIPPCASLRARVRGQFRRVVLVAGFSAALVAATLTPAGAVTVTPAHTTTSVTVTWRGNGHGHGLSQYGARGAAAAGLSFRRIISFYYPHTTLVRPKQPVIRVLLADFGPATTVAAWSGLTVTGVRGKLPTRGIFRYRLIADAGSGLTLQRLRSAAGSRWTTYRTGLPNRAAFNRGVGYSVQIFAPNGTSNYYRGLLRAVRTTASGAGRVNTVNVVGLERYTAGVAPREMPASWARAAVDAQAIAARTYAQYAIDHPRNRDWDICDTTACQFYGGYEYLDARGHVVWHDDTTGVLDTNRLVVTYRGAAIFAQFSASNGGWTVAGGQPYLIARPDPYDTAKSGDPYLAMTGTVSLASLARAYGLSKITRIATTTNGHGAWGGRTTGATIDGVRSGKAVRVTTSGFALADALGAWTDWYRLVAN
ncbi:SpoIID/LytB domain-containing protein [uncultured Jatrophihabitans sp.]|uniref:SpoIID/LytB domain-containing protein n=1 Tax=uncultured Jatrophihabitans sp. TaxID=1610747 RepID=UPI0035CA8E34